MTPGKLDLVCPQGSTFSRTLTYKIDDTPVNLVGYNARLQVREYHSAPDYVIGIDSFSANSSGVGSLPISCNIWRDVRTSLLMVSIICTGIRMVRA